MRWFSLLGCLLTSMAAGSPVFAEEPSETIQSALAQTVNLDFDNLTLDECADRLRTLVKRPVVVHESLRPLLAIREQKLQAHDVAVGAPPPPGGLGGPAPVPVGDSGVNVSLPQGFSCSLRQMPLGSALRVFLEHYGLGYVNLDETLVIATAEQAHRLQVSQPVTLRLEKVSLTQAVDMLTKRYGIDLTVDAMAVRDGKTLVTVLAREVSLENAVHLLADAINLKAAPLGQGWLLTTADKARDWEARAKRQAPATVKIVPGVAEGLGGVMDVGVLAGGVGAPGIVAFGNVETVEVPRALLQVAGPQPRVGQAVEKVTPAVPLGKAVEPRKSASGEILKKLQESFDFPNPAPMTLKEALEVLQGNGLPRLVIDQRAFKEENADAPDIHESHVLPPRAKGGLNRAKILRLILDQIPSGNAAYLVRPGHIEITTVDGARPNRQFVQANFTNVPLAEALQELSEQTGISILLDPRVGDRAKTPVSARFPGETNLAQAVRLLADMADLKAVVIDNMIYVTSRSNAVLFPEEPGPGRSARREVAAGAE